MRVGGKRLGSTYKHFALALMAALFMLNLVDRGLMILFLQPIKEDLQLSDTQLGFLTGIAFGLFYATLGIPIARWADRGNRVSIASLAISVWGMTVMACLWVASYPQLVVARIAAAVGEAGCKPPTYSLIGDYFPAPVERTRAMAIYWLAGPLSTIVSFMVGGWLNSLYGWRMTFFIMGIPGLLLAVIVKLVVVEPRALQDANTAPQPPLPPLRAVFALLWKQKSLRHLSIALILVFMMGLGLAPWYAAFLMRSHGMATAELGVWLGMIFGLGGVAGVVLGGQVANRRFKGNEGGQMRMNAVTVAFLVPCFAAFLLLPEKYPALIALIPLVMTFNFYTGPLYAVMQRLVPDEMRATVLAVILFLANLLGMGIGPQIVGLLSDALRPQFGNESLRYAMLAMSFVALWAAYHFWQVGRTVREDLGSFSITRGSEPHLMGLACTKMHDFQHFEISGYSEAT